jgi:two-component system, OmpR family, phosphate regulon sensor histidine kinase PhoR
MNRIIRGILDLERIKNRAAALELCSPQRIIQDVIHELTDQAQGRGITLHGEVPEGLPAFACDTEQFKRALVNLVENAIKFSTADGNVWIRASAQSSSITFEVQDQGVGIPAENHDRVFDRFFRANQKGVEHVTGTGLGLSIVKAVVENHGGEVWLESDVGQGTRFFVAMPYKSENVPT